jgi:hypothetical protein
VGTLLLTRQNEAVVINEDSKTFRGDAALWMLYGALVDERLAEPSKAPRRK